MLSFQLRQGLSKLLTLTGGINYFWNKLPNGVYAFNYHRIGDKDKSPFDRAIFSCTEQAFEQQIIVLKQHFKIINTIELAKLIKRNDKVNDRFAVITFDDGYLDNFTIALPILKKHQVTAVFYLTTDFLDSNKITWWDEIAYLLRKSVGNEYQLPKSNYTYTLVKENIDNIIRNIMSEIKQTKYFSVLDALENIRMKFPLAHQTLLAEEHQLFMNWQQANELLIQGMEVGSHTLTHPILSQIGIEQHEKEIVDSKLLLEQRLNCKINSIAYPVGRYYCYNEQTIEFTLAAGYKIAFNNEPGFHRSIDNALDINRFCVATNDVEYLKYECCFI
jgi:peptidoglycan/xylan/chitin deacetylase (PgdA/CDA1 family)